MPRKDTEKGTTNTNNQSWKNRFSGLFNSKSRSHNSSDPRNVPQTGRAGVAVPAMNALSEQSSVSESGESNDLMKEMERNRLKAQSEHEERLRAMRQRAEEEDEREEQQHQENMRAQRLADKERNKRMQEEQEKLEKEQDEQHRRRQENERRKMDEEQETMRNNQAIESEAGEERRQRELDLIRLEGAQELENIRRERQRENEEFERTVQEQNEQAREAATRHEEETRIREEELRHIQEEHEEKLRSIIEEFESLKNEMDNQHQEKVNRLEKQWEQIVKAFQYKIWNDVIEKNWTDRLSALRSSNKKVAELFNRFEKQAYNIQRHIEKNEDISNEKQMMIPIVKAISAAVRAEKELMIQESNNLQSQWEQTGKKFVNYIKEKVDDVKSSCDILGEHLVNYFESFKQETHLFSNNHAHFASLISSSFKVVSNCSMKIPTMAELKEVHKGEMQKNNEDSSTSQQVVPFESVIIEEVE